VEDITFLPCLEQTMYLNTIEDLFNGEILAYAISDSVNTKLCTDTVEILVEKVKITKEIILHSDYAEEKTMPKFLGFIYPVAV